MVLFAFDAVNLKTAKQQLGGSKVAILPFPNVLGAHGQVLNQALDGLHPWLRYTLEAHHRASLAPLWISSHQGQRVSILEHSLWASCVHLLRAEPDSRKWADLVIQVRAYERLLGTPEPEHTWATPDLEHPDTALWRWLANHHPGQLSLTTPDRLTACVLRWLPARQQRAPRALHTAEFVSVSPQAEAQVVYMARVSNPHHQDFPRASKRLLRYLITHRHWSPFEMVHLTLRIHTTVAIARHLLRHSFDVQEFSQRYANPEVLGPPITPDVRRQSKSRKQSSVDDLDASTVKQWQLQVQHVTAQTHDLYRRMVRAGVAFECARAILPMNTRTTLFLTGNARTYFHYLQLRLQPDTQREHRHLARGIEREFRKHFPLLAAQLHPRAPPELPAPHVK